jgi:hypothetical protein
MDDVDDTDVAAPDDTDALPSPPRRG